MTPIGFKRISISFLQRTLTFFCAGASRLDVAGVCHSSGHAETRQHPSHQHNVGREECNEPQPVRHKFVLLSSAAGLVSKHIFLNLIPTRTIALILNSNRRATELPDEEIKTFRMERTNVGEDCEEIRKLRGRSDDRARNCRNSAVRLGDKARPVFDDGRVPARS